MSQKNLEILTKIVLIYSLFYVGLKIAMILQGAWMGVNLILALPFALWAVGGGYLLKTKKLSWIFSIAGILIILVSRFFEKEWALTIRSFLG